MKLDQFSSELFADARNTLQKKDKKCVYFANPYILPSLTIKYISLHLFFSATVSLVTSLIKICRESFLIHLFFATQLFKAWERQSLSIYGQLLDTMPATLFAHISFSFAGSS